MNSTIATLRTGTAARMTRFLLGSLVLVFSFGVLGAGTASADPVVTAPIVAPAGYDIHLFADVDLSSSVVGYLPDGHNVTILCTMQGESVTSEINGYSSSLWNGVSVDGTDMVGFVPDVYVDTRTYQPTMPNCQDIGNATDV